MVVVEMEVVVKWGGRRGAGGKVQAEAVADARNDGRRSQCLSHASCDGHARRAEQRQRDS